MARRRLGLELAVVLTAKLILLGALYFLFFTGEVANDAPATASHVIGDR